MNQEIHTAPKVSVVIVAWNAEKTLAEAIESILQQSYRNFELLIIDDASSDETWSIVEKYRKKDGRIRTFRHDSNLGIAAARNHGIELAGGEYLAWQDADDISLPDRIENQVSFLDTHPKVGVVGGDLLFFSEHGDLSLRKYFTDDAQLRKMIFRVSPIAQPASMVRVQCYQQVGMYDLRYPPAEDLDMWFRIGSAWKFANVGSTVLRYRISPTSATFQKIKKLERSTFSIRMKNVRNPAYRWSMIDIVFNIVQYCVLFWLPARTKVWLLSLVRNTSVS